MSAEQHQLEAGIRALEAQRSLLGDAVVDASLAGLRAKLSTLAAPPRPPDPVQTLRQVSILFLDVVGFTSLANGLDPEAIGEVMGDALLRGTAIVEAHRGKVLQYAGDSILAAFGADQKREDDAERAVLCGLALLELGKALGAEVKATYGHSDFDVRVGVHTGDALVGGGANPEGGIHGIAVNIAARMEQNAPPGALRISHDTYAQVRGMFEVDAQEPLTVKGVGAPVRSYLVVRAKPRNFRIRTHGIEGIATKMIGRAAEFEALQAVFARLFSERGFAAVTVVADAGIGKSRLLNEFEVWSESRPERFFLFRGRATPQTAAQAFGLLRDLVAWRFQIADDESVELARRKLEDGMVPLFLHDDGPDLAEAHAHLLGHLIGIEWKDSRHIRGILDDPRQIRNRAFHAAAQMFRRIGASDGSPVLLQLEDLQWADGESLDFLSYLAEVNRDVPLLVLAVARPTLFESKSYWWRSEDFHQRIDLVPLDKRASRELAGELLKKLPEVPAALREFLTSSAEGNPFYMEELVKMLIDQGAIETRSVAGDTWVVNAEQLLLTNVPTTLTGVLQARLDGLPPGERLALQHASIIGTVFWDQALAAIETKAAEQLPALVQREVVLPRADPQLDGLREYSFHHQLLHQVTYDTVLKQDKREGHARVAKWLAGLTEQGSLRLGNFLGLAAEHFEHAGDAANAAEFHTRAAEQAGMRLAHDRVTAHVGMALARLGVAEPAQAELRWRLLSVRERTLSVQGRRAEQAADLDSLTRLADALDDDRRRAYAAWRSGILAMRMADWEAMANAARYGMSCASRAGDDGLRLHTLRLLATAQMQRGDIKEGQSQALQGLAEARGLGLELIEAHMLNALAVSAQMTGDLVSVLELTQQSLLATRKAGNRVGEAIALTNLGLGSLYLGDLSRARRDLDSAIPILRANGDRTCEGAALAALSAVALWQGDEAHALALARSALDMAVAVNARELEVAAGMCFGAAELALGRVNAARQAYTRAQVRAIEIDSLEQHDISAGLAQVALSEHDDAAALAALQPVVDQVAAGGNLDGTEYPRLIELTCYQVQARAGDPRAAEWLARAHVALMAQADAISDSTLRQGFLYNIPHHRAIVAEWANRDVP